MNKLWDWRVPWAISWFQKVQILFRLRKIARRKSLICMCLLLAKLILANNQIDPLNLYLKFKVQALNFIEYVWVKLVVSLMWWVGPQKLKFHHYIWVSKAKSKSKESSVYIGFCGLSLNQGKFNLRSKVKFNISSGGFESYAQCVGYKPQWVNEKAQIQFRTLTKMRFKVCLYELFCKLSLDRVIINLG